MLIRSGTTSILPVIALVVATMGCHATNTRSTATRSTEKPAPRTNEPISQVAALWSEAVLRQGTVPVAQGFTGKVYLFGTDSTQPVTTPGKFIVYAYDDAPQSKGKPDRDRAKPSYQWELDESQLRGLVKQDAVGWSYSLWLPVGPPEPTARNFTIILTFVPETGRRVMSDSALVTLPAVGAAPQLGSVGTVSHKSVTKEDKPAVMLAGNVASE
jgi:hypothetical protein